MLTALCGDAANPLGKIQNKSLSWLPDDERFHADKAKQFESAGLKYGISDALPGSLSSIFQALPDLTRACFNAKPERNEFLSFGIYDQLFRDDDADPLAQERKVLTIGPPQL